MNVEDAGGAYTVDVKVEIKPPGEDPGSVATDESPGNNDGGAAASTQSSDTASGRRTRQRWSGPSDTRPSSTTAQPLKRAKSGKSRTGCGRDACGEEGPGGVRVCSACHQAPTETANGPRWVHFQSDEAVADAASAWARHSATPFPTHVKGGFFPSRDNCLCNRGACFLRQVVKWRNLAEIANARKCAVCASSRTTGWKHAGAALPLYRRFFTSSHAKCSRLYLSGGTLDGDSWLCNPCYADAYRNARKVFRADKSTVEGYINLLELHSPAPSKDTLAFTDRAMLLYCLRRLKEGELVCLADVVDAMRSARKDSGLSSMNEESLRPKVLGMFRDLARGVVGADHFSFDGGEVGDRDKRIHAHYLMPSKFSPRYVASLHRGVRMLEKKETESRSSTEGGVGRDVEQASAGTGAEGGGNAEEERNEEGESNS